MHTHMALYLVVETALLEDLQHSISEKRFKVELREVYLYVVSLLSKAYSGSESANTCTRDEDFQEWWFAGHSV